MSTANFYVSCIIYMFIIIMIFNRLQVDIIFPWEGGDKTRESPLCSKAKGYP